MRCAWLIAALLISGCAAAPVSAPIPLLLTFANGTCSGTAIAPHAILTATHCFDAQLEGLTVARRIDDGDDHTLLVVAQTFKARAEFAPMPKLGARIHITANPGELRGIYAAGVVAGSYKGDTLLEMPIFYGDSGAAVFDGNGRIVGMVSGIRVLAGGGVIVQWGEAKPFMFTAAQWAEAGL